MCATARPERSVRDSCVRGIWAEVEIVGWSVYGTPYGTPAMLDRARDERRKEEEPRSGEGSSCVGSVLTGNTAEAENYKFESGIPSYESILVKEKTEDT